MADRPRARAADAPDDDVLEAELEAPRPADNWRAVPAPPSLMDAFTVLCAALQAALEDNEVLIQHCLEMQAWMANTGGDAAHPNSLIAWRHAIQMLEGVLGQSLTQR